MIESPYRAVVSPLLAYIDVWRQAHAEPLCTVVLPEFVGHGWGIWLHNHRAFWLKVALLTRRGVAVADATYHMRRAHDSKATASEKLTEE